MSINTLEVVPEDRAAQTRPDDAALLHACMRLAEATSLVDLERRVNDWLAQIGAPDRWQIVCHIAGFDEPVVKLHGGTRGVDGAGEAYALRVPLKCNGSLSGHLDLGWNVAPAEKRIDATGAESGLGSLARILATTLSRLCSELQALAQRAELAFVRSLTPPARMQRVAPELDSFAADLLDQLDVTSLQIVVRGPFPGGVSWGISARRGDLALLIEERHRLLQFVDCVTEQPGKSRKHVVFRAAELNVLAVDFGLPYLSQLKSLLLVPIRDGDKPVGAVMAGEARSWSRQPISRQAILVCTMLAPMIATSATQTQLLGEVIERGEFMQILFDSLDDGILTVQDGQIVSWNQTASHLFGYTREEVLGKYVVDVLPGAPPELFVEHKAEEVFPHPKRSFEWKMQTTGGHDLLLLCTVTEMRDAGASGPTAMYVFREVGQERELEYLKDELLSSVSHELRTPLNGIYGFSRLLLERPHMSEAMRKEALKSLQASTERLTRMADDFIDVARARRHRLPVELEEVDIGGLVRDARGELKRRHPAHRIRIQVQKDLPLVRADSLRIKQILDNLVSNAAKYSPEETEFVFRVRLRGDELAVSVSDHGCGIPKGVQDRIFEAFYRADNSRSHRASGVGLGLSIVKSLVEAHDGRVEVRSTLGRGSTFTFALPVTATIGA